MTDYMVDLVACGFDVGVREGRDRSQEDLARRRIRPPPRVASIDKLSVLRRNLEVAQQSCELLPDKDSKSLRLLSPKAVFAFSPVRDHPRAATK